MLKRPVRVAALAIVLACVAATHAAIPDQVRIDTGLVSGTAGTMPTVRVFKGIPFAAPPVGDLRWRPPQPAARWDGVRAATAFGPNCVQRSADGAKFPPYGGDRSARTMNEDCLYLNVYTAASSSSSAHEPVMVWIHGGAWTSGSGAIYQGEDLARKGVVVVTFNYRLGALGFLAHPELTKESPHHSSGNYALLDQIAALRWVQRNIAAFGGDPSRVTIFGESAGSWSVNNLVASPLASGLFQRAIGESGARFSIRTTLAAAEQDGMKFGQSVGAPTLAALRAKPADALVPENDFRTVSNADGWVLPATTWDIYNAGHQNDVPIVIGSNSDEGSIFTRDTVTSASFREQVQRRYGADADRYLAQYRFTSDREARLAQAHSLRDEMFGWEMRTWARAQARTGHAKAFLYYFSHVPPLPDASWLGAQHGAEIPYVLNWPNGTHSANVPWTDVDRKLADQVSSYWVNFATTGDPNGKGLPSWPAFDLKSERALGIGDSIAVVPPPNGPALDIIDTQFMKTRREPATARQ